MRAGQHVVAGGLTDDHVCSASIPNHSLQRHLSTDRWASRVYFYNNNHKSHAYKEERGSVACGVGRHRHLQVHSNPFIKKHTDIKEKGWLGLRWVNISLKRQDFFLYCLYYWWALSCILHMTCKNLQSYVSIIIQKILHIRTAHSCLFLIFYSLCPDRGNLFDRTLKCKWFQSQWQKEHGDHSNVGCFSGKNIAGIISRINVNHLEERGKNNNAPGCWQWDPEHQT